MPIPELQIKTAMAEVGAFIEKRRPKPDIRHLVDIHATLQKQELIVFELRQRYNEPSRMDEHPVAKAKWIDSQNRWKLYWMRADLKWHLY